MPSENNIPFKSSVKIDNERNLEMQANLANKSAEVVNLVNGEKWTNGGGGGDSDFSTAEVTFKTDRNNYTIKGITYIAPKAGTVTNYFTVEQGTDVTLIIPLYKGNADIYIDIFYGVNRSFTPVCTGDVEIGEFGFKITGDCSITLDGEGVQ